MKKLMALLLALVLSFSLVACGKNTEKDDTKEETKATDKAEKDIEEATAVVEDFMDALMDLDAKKAAKYIDDEDAIPEEFSQYSDALDDVLEGMMSGLPAEVEAYRDDIESRMKGFMDKVVAKAKDVMDYEITDVEKDGDNYVFTVSLTAADDASDPFADLDIETFLAEKATEWYEDGTITDSSTEEDLFELMIPAMFDYMEEALDDVELETTTNSTELVVVPDGNDWIISADESDL